jgi:hypothetical protein
MSYHQLENIQIGKPDSSLKTFGGLDLALIEEYHEKILLSVRCIIAGVLFFGVWWYCSSKPYITGVSSRFFELKFTF